MIFPVLLLFAQIMGWDQYRAAAAARPSGIIRQESLVYFGSRHSRDGADPQMAEIERLWTTLQPSVALIEGGVPPVATSAREAMERYGEMGFVRFLAARDHVPVKSLDPSHEDQVKALQRVFPADTVKAFFALRAFTDGRADPMPKDLQKMVPDWRSATNAWFDPTQNVAFTNEIVRELTQVRNRHMLATVRNELAAGKRVFAIAGRTHVIMQSPALAG
jgi:hypothetical protein